MVQNIFELDCEQSHSFLTEGTCARERRESGTQAFLG